MRYALRSLSRTPLLSIAAILTVALGMGVNTAIFSLVQAVLLKPLPFEKPDRLVYVWQTHPSLGNLPAAYPDFQDWRAAKSFDVLSAYTFQAMNKTALEGEPVQATMASPDLFPMLGIHLISGRVFSAQDGPVALISEALWRRRFSAAPDIAGRTIRLGLQEVTVIGVVRQHEAFPAWADVWLPLSQIEPGLRESRRFHPLEVVGRLRRGVSIEQAQAEMSAIGANAARQYPATEKNLGAFVIPMLQQVTGPVRPTLLIVWLAVGLVLLVACANVAHLLLVRTMSRERELAIRASLGASPLHLIRLLGNESLLLVGMGGFLGLAAAALSLPVLKSLSAPYLPRVDEVGFNVNVVLCVMGAMLLCCVLVALPSLRKLLQGDLGQPSKGRAGRSGHWMIAAEVALTFLVLAGAILLLRSFSALRRVNSGFQADHVVTLQLTISPPGDAWTAAAHLFDNQLRPALQALPNVSLVADANMAPLSLGRTETSRFASRFGIQGRTYSPGTYPVAQLRWVSADYFAALKIPLLRGQMITRGPRRLINETLARRFFPGEDPIGKELLFGVGTPHIESSPIAGIVGDVRDLSLDIDPLPTIYLIDTSPSIALLIRVQGDPHQSLPAITRVVRQAAPQGALTPAEPLEALVDQSLARFRFSTWLMTGFAALAILLAVTGIYAVIAFGSSRRTREFGIRAALGATPARVLRLAVLEGFAMIAVGVMAGLALFVMIGSRLFRSLIYGVPTVDAFSLAASAAAVAVIAVAAISIPAYRAAHQDPQSALRAD